MAIANKHFESSWVAPKTCTVSEFSKITGIDEARARECARCAYPPAGFTIGNRYRIILERMDAFVAEYREYERAMENLCRRSTCSLAEFAESVGISKDRAYSYVHSPFAPRGYLLDGKVRILAAYMDDYLEERAAWEAGDERKRERRGLESCSTAWGSYAWEKRKGQSRMELIENHVVDGEEVGGAATADPDKQSIPKTCSVAEFARILGIGKDAANSLIDSDFPPPGFKVGRSYRIITARIDEYMEALYQRELEQRGLRLPKWMR